MDRAFPRYVGKGTGTAVTSVSCPIPCSDLRGEHLAVRADGHSGTDSAVRRFGVVAHRRPASQAFCSRQSIFKLSESSGLVLSFG